MKKKLLLSTLVVIILAVIGVWFFIFYKPTHFKRDVAEENGIVVTANAIVKAYQTNEADANKTYLNKAVQVTGEVAEAKLDQAGKNTVTLKSEDAFSNVYCTLKQADNTVQPGKTVTVKGICTGFLSDVVIIDAIVVK